MTSKEEQVKKILSKYIPKNAIDYCYELIKENKILLEISEDSNYALGEYKKLKEPTPCRHKIRINHSLNKYEFLITLIHEIAHLKTNTKYNTINIKPHGKEWKTEFKLLMYYLLDKSIFPEDILFHLKKHMLNPKYTQVVDINLMRTLHKYDPPGKFSLIENLHENTIFIYNGEKYIFKGKSNKSKYYQAIKISNKKKYLFLPIAKVCIVSIQDQS